MGSAADPRQMASLSQTRRLAESNRWRNPLALSPLRKGGGTAAYIVQPGPLESPCWVWQGCRNSKGYAVRGTKHERYLVHRRVYEQTVGLLADDEQIHHLCRERACVNPAHVEPVTQLEHSRVDAPISARALAYLAEFGPQQVSVVARELGVTRGSVSTAFHRSIARGEVVRTGRGHYAVPQAAEVAA